jgi:DNA-binding transcriptional MerR regulator
VHVQGACPFFCFIPHVRFKDIAKNDLVKALENESGITLKRIEEMLKARFQSHSSEGNPFGAYRKMREFLDSEKSQKISTDRKITEYFHQPVTAKRPRLVDATESIDTSGPCDVCGESSKEPPQKKQETHSEKH